MFISVEEATILVGLITSIVIPFLVSWIKRNAWPAWVRLLIALVISGIGGWLTLIADKNVPNTTSIIIYGSALFTVAQVWYRTWFTGLGIEEWLNPPAPLVQAAAEQAAAQTEAIVKDVLEDKVP